MNDLVVADTPQEQGSYELGAEGFLNTDALESYTVAELEAVLAEHDYEKRDVVTMGWDRPNYTAATFVTSDNKVVTVEIGKVNDYTLEVDIEDIDHLTPQNVRALRELAGDRGRYQATFALTPRFLALLDYVEHSTLPGAPVEVIQTAQRSKIMALFGALRMGHSA